MFVALVADDVTVVDAVEVLCTDDRDIEGTHWAGDKVSTVDFSGLGQHFLGMPELLVTSQDVLFQILLALY